jgi:phage terminase Nu1 subunit (DNA packaging protein)
MENNLENQEPIPGLTEDTLSNGKEEKNPFLKIIQEQAVESKLQQLFDINPKIWYELKDKGIIPNKGTYKDFLIPLFQHYRKKNDAYLRKVELQQEKYTGNASRETESGLPKIIEAEKYQKIRLDRAREQEVHLKNLATRKELINKNELYSLVSPLVGNIANILRSAADDDPKMQEVVDKCFVSLYNVAKKLVGQAEEDESNYVRYMLDQPIDLDAIIDNADLELENV